MCSALERNQRRSRKRDMAVNGKACDHEMIIIIGCHDVSGGWLMVPAAA